MCRDAMFYLQEGENSRGRQILDKKNPLPKQRIIFWQGRRDSNSQHPVLETGALPIELRP